MVSSSISSSASDWAKAKILPSSFYARETGAVSRDLLGKILVVKTGNTATAVRIVETEAYGGSDPASHSSRGETPRCSVMFGPPGVAYVYFIYGMYEMLNFVTEPKGKPGAVLIRAAEPVFGEDLMFRRRKGVRSRLELTRGPGKLCRAMGIQLRHNGLSLLGPVLEVRDDGFKPGKISASPRVGITAGTEKYWRYFITEHPFVSRAPQNSDSIIWREWK